jgi:hypothetical protein
MNDRVYFADVELPFHVWVREGTGGNGYRWVLRDARAAEPPLAPPEPGCAGRPHDESK